MSVDPEVRLGWRKNWLRSIQEFADGETQRRSWLNPMNRNPHFSFGEYFCSYFDDLNLSNGGYKWAIDEGLVSAEEVAAVAHFHESADTYDSPTDDYDHEAILADPKWAEVVSAAKEAQANLLPLLAEPAERRALMRRSRYAAEATRCG